jgi:cytochrome c biogenesis protein CcdA
MIEIIIPLLFASVIGFQHAFEADHLVAVSSIVAKRNNSYLAIKDGIYWGLGHTSTILLIGLVILVGKFALAENIFAYLEAGVGVMLVILGFFRLNIFFKYPDYHRHLVDENDNHHLAYSVGAIHGLAGSGAMILLVMTEIKETLQSIIYLLIFGMGSIAGMLIAAGIFSLPLSKNFTQFKFIRLTLSLISSLLCIGLGIWVIYKNIYG